MTRRNGFALCAAGVLALIAPVVLEWFGVWFPAAAFLGWAGLLMFGSGVLVLAAVGLEDRR